MMPPSLLLRCVHVEERRTRGARVKVASEGGGSVPGVLMLLIPNTVGRLSLMANFISLPMLKTGIYNVDGGGAAKNGATPRESLFSTYIMG